MFTDDTAPTPTTCRRFPQCPGGRKRKVAFSLDNADLAEISTGGGAPEGAPEGASSTPSSVVTGIVIFFVVVLLLALFFWAPWRGAQSPAVQLLQKRHGSPRSAPEKDEEEPRFPGDLRTPRHNRFHHIANALS